MIGSSNAIGKSLDIATETVRINLLTNHSEDASLLVGKIVTITYDGQFSEYIWDGSEITAKIIPDQTYTIEFEELEGYMTPALQTFTSIEGNKRDVEGIYESEFCTVNVGSDNSNAVSGYTVTVSGVGSQTTSTKTYKIPFGTSYTVSASNVDGYDSPNSVTYTANSVSRSVTMTYTYNPAKDLSMFNIYGTAISQTTANCYIIKEAGQYKFPLVYGNAIKDGAINSAAYTKASEGTVMDFVNYSNTKITSPYIETDTGKTITSAEISMADTDGGLTGLSVVSGSNCKYIQFTVTSVPIVGANYVVSAKNSSGTILWSWHIWLWPNDLSVKTLTNATNVNYDILPVNLATKLDSESALTSTTGWKNWFYQWGRPTPMLPPASYNSNTDHTNYGVQTFTKATSPASNYGVGIQNPQTFYCTNDYPYNWFGDTSYYNLWDAACTTTGNSDNVVVKTVYDPSPIGFHIPNGNTFTYFSTSNIVGSFSNGYRFKCNKDDNTGVFFLASGNRRNSSGSLDIYISINGYYWISSANSSTNAYNLAFGSYGSASVHPQGSNYRSYGFSVRCVAE